MEYDKIMEADESNFKEVLQSMIINHNYNKGLIILPTTKQLSFDLIEFIPDYINIRIKSGYHDFFLKNRAMANKVTYNKEELSKILLEIENIEKLINKDWNLYEKCLFIYDYLKRNIKFGLPEEEGINKTSNINYRDKKYDSLTGLFEKESTCNGINIMFNELIRRQHCKCKLRSGEYIDKEKNISCSHTWNMVNIENNIFIVDPTWDFIRYRNKLDTTLGFGTKDRSNYESFEDDSNMKFIYMDTEWINNFLSKIKRD